VKAPLLRRAGGRAPGWWWVARPGCCTLATPPAAGAAFSQASRQPRTRERSPPCRRQGRRAERLVVFCEFGVEIRDLWNGLRASPPAPVSAGERCALRQPPGLSVAAARGGTALLVSRRLTDSAAATCLACSF
jgi:hypothetical protein